jgi:hypothetical protein
MLIANSLTALSNLSNTMKICQSTYRSDAWESVRIDEGFSSEKAQLVIVFGERKFSNKWKFIRKFVRIFQMQK